MIPHQFTLSGAKRLAALTATRTSRQILLLTLSGAKRLAATTASAHAARSFYFTLSGAKRLDIESATRTSRQILRCAQDKVAAARSFAALRMK